MYIIFIWKEDKSVVSVTHEDGANIIFDSLIEARKYAKGLNYKWKIFYS